MPVRAKILIRGIALAAVSSMAIVSGASAETLPSTPTSSPTTASEPVPGVQAENQPQRLQLCEKDNPAIDYRACVNASTRDLSKKIRQA
jgi:hypothetical protein